ncbi:MAG: protein translocase subunit SecF [bacterium]
MNIAIIKNKKYWLGFSGVLLLTCVIFIFIFGLKLGIDFTGGSLLEVKINSDTSFEARVVTEKLESLDFLESAKVQPTENNGLFIRMKTLTEEEHQSVLVALEEMVKPENATDETPATTENEVVNTEEATTSEKAPAESLIIEQRFESIGPVIGSEMARKSIYAIIFVLVGIISYLAWAFKKVGSDVSPWKFGACAIFALIHDLLIVVGVFALLGKVLNVEIDTMFITALLTVLGFSVHDTIVVFDRVRYNLLRNAGDNFADTVNLSVNQTIVRSINTSVTTLLVLLALYFLGGATISWFVLALIVGIIAGTYSSIFFASPILVAWQKK